MKDFIELNLMWLSHIFWLIVLFIITSVGLGILKEIGLNYENSICTIYGYIIGLVCCKIIYKGNKK